MFAATMMLTASASALDMELSPYRRVEGLSGTLKSVGSDTMQRQMELWAEGFKSIYPNVNIVLEGKGSNTAPPALLAGAANIGPMSRLMTPDEIKAFQGKYGYKPTAVLVATDALAIYVNKDNPIQCISMENLDRIFSAEPKASDGRSIGTWGELGLTGEWASKPIALYGRNTLSGTYIFFKQNVLGGGNLKETVRQLAGSGEVVSAVTNEKYAIGYSGIGYKSDGVRAVPVSANSGNKCHGPSFENSYSRQYPISRGLYLYVLKNPREPLDSLAGEFVKYVLSKDGQTQAKRGGYYPITRNIREHELTRLGLLLSESR